MTLREKLVTIGARLVRHGRYVVFQLAEVAVPRALFAEILRRIDELRPSGQGHRRSPYEDWADERRQTNRRGAPMTDPEPLVREIRSGSSADARPSLSSPAGLDPRKLASGTEPTHPRPPRSVIPGLHGTRRRCPDFACLTYSSGAC